MKKEKKVRYTIAIAPSFLSKLKEISVHERRPPTQLTRIIIEDFINNYKKAEKP